MSLPAVTAFGEEWETDRRGDLAATCSYEAPLAEVLYSQLPIQASFTAELYCSEAQWMIQGTQHTPSSEGHGALGRLGLFSARNQP